MGKKIQNSERHASGRRGFRVGDWVQFHFISRDLQGRIMEDRGAIGIGGHHLYRVLVDTDEERRELELPADELKAVSSC